jgi:rSAM/selenodomain-associated transferase 1
MAKRPVPGRVKTRLVAGGLSAHQAAAVHAAMLECVLARVPAALPGRAILALDGSPAEPLTHSDPELSVHVPSDIQTLDQGTGDLGQRLDHVWQIIDPGPVAFFGVDSPDVPTQALASIYDSLARADAAVGPVTDGGYWCLAARRYAPELITGIDWGTHAVYHQTREAARVAGLNLLDLPAWHDVDTADDLDALRQRIHAATDPALLRLRQRLDRITQDPPPP